MGRTKRTKLDKVRVGLTIMQLVVLIILIGNLVKLYTYEPCSMYEQYFECGSYKTNERECSKHLNVYHNPSLTFTPSIDEGEMIQKVCVSQNQDSMNGQLTVKVINATNVTSDVYEWVMNETMTWQECVNKSVVLKCADP